MDDFLGQVRRLPNVNGAEFGEWARALRESAGINQADFARMIGFDQSHVSKVERGHKTVTADYAIAFARAMNIDRGVALAKAGLDDEPMDERSEELAELRSIFEQLSDEDQRMLIDTARAWLQSRERTKRKDGKLKTA